MVEEFPGGLKLRKAVDFSSFEDDILAELENIEGDAKDVAPVIYFTLTAANKSGMKTTKEFKIAFDLFDPVIEIDSWAWKTRDANEFKVDKSETVLFQLNLIDPEVSKINDVTVWAPASGIDLSTFKLYVDNNELDHPIKNCKPLITVGPLSQGDHVIAMNIEDNVGRVSVLKFEVNAITPTGIEDDDAVPTEFSLEQSYPNPFNPTTTINYSLAKDSHVMLTIYNSLGNVVEEIMNAQKSAGYHKISWDASAQPSGIYFYKLTTDEFSDIKKCILLK